MRTASPAGSVLKKLVKMRSVKRTATVLQNAPDVLGLKVMNLINAVDAVVTVSLMMIVQAAQHVRSSQQPLMKITPMVAYVNSTEIVKGVSNVRLAPFSLCVVL